MKQNEYVADYIVAATGTVSPTESLHRIRHRMESDEMPSIIVAEDNRPVGVIRWSDIREADGIPDICLARDIMLPGCPTLTARSSAREAYASLTVSDLDRLPVVDARGKLVGVVSRDALLRAADGYSAHASNGSPATPLAAMKTRRVFTVHPGMNVFSADKVSVGLVDRMFLERGTVTGVLVAYGIAARHKHLGFDVVDHLEDETILLSIDADHFHNLQDIHA